MEIDWITVVFRCMHMLAAMAAVGGTIFMRQAMLPAVESLPESERARFYDVVRTRWAIYIHLSIVFLLLSGTYGFYRAIAGDERPAPGPYHALFSVKFLLALAIFFIASLLVGRSEAADRFRQRRRFWLTINVVLAVVLVCISGLMRSIPRRPAAEERTSATARPERNILRSPTRRIRLDMYLTDARATAAGILTSRPVEMGLPGQRTPR